MIRPPDPLPIDVNDWDDLRFFLAASRGGSFSAAARDLGVSQPTVSRRVAQLEAVLDARLFEHRHGRLELTAPGHHVVAFSEKVEDATHQLRRMIEGTESLASGKVGVTATEGLASQWLAPKLAEFRNEYPDIEVTLQIGARKLDLMRGEADIALRFGNPDSLDLIGRRVAEAHAGIYASRGYLERHGAPESLEDLSRFHLIEATGEIAGYRQCEKLNLLMRDAPHAGSVDNPYTQLALADAGMGLIGIMCYMAEGYGSLVRLLPDRFDVSLDLWLLTHPALKSSARVRAVIDFITAKIVADKALFRATET